MDQDYEKNMEFQYETLDKIDFKPYIEEYKGKKFSDFISAIERDYDNTDVTNNDVLQGCIFNWLSEDEQTEYFEHRYGRSFRTYEVTTTYISK